MHHDLTPIRAGVIREKVRMGRKPKQKRTFRVKRMYEPDRMSIVNLQSAYEQLIPPQRYWVVALEPGTIKQSEELPLKEEVMG